MDGNIHKSEGNKNITLVECQNFISRTLICKSKQNCKYSMQQKDILFSAYTIIESKMVALKRVQVNLL